MRHTRARPAGGGLKAATGGCSVLLGRNGAGKTTTSRTIMGLWGVAKSEMTFARKPHVGLGTPRIAQRGITFVPEDMGIFGDLSVQENMILAARNGPFGPPSAGLAFPTVPAAQDILGYS